MVKILFREGAFVKTQPQQIKIRYWPLIARYWAIIRHRILGVNVGTG